MHKNESFFLSLNSLRFFETALVVTHHCLHTIIAIIYNKYFLIHIKNRKIKNTKIEKNQKFQSEFETKRL